MEARILFFFPGNLKSGGGVTGVCARLWGGEEGLTINHCIKNFFSTIQENVWANVSFEHILQSVSHLESWVPIVKY